MDAVFSVNQPDGRYKEDKLSGKKDNSLEYMPALPQGSRRAYMMGNRQPACRYYHYTSQQVPGLPYGGGNTFSA